MAVRIFRRQAANPAVNVNVDIYQVPAGKRAIVRSIFQGYDGGVVDASMGVYARGVGMFWDQKVSQFDSRIWPCSTVLDAGETIGAYHTQAGMYTMVQIAELDQRDAENLWRLQFNSVGAAAQTYTVPAGKRVRVREVILANHGDTADYSVYIASIGHLVKHHAVARVGNVFGMDMSVNAGETIGAVVPVGPAGHVFLSGVIEDA